MMINKLNEIIREDFVKAPYKEEDFIFIESLLNIILSNQFIKEIAIYHSFMNFDQCLEHSLIFLDTIDSRYSEMAREIIFSDSCYVSKDINELSRVINYNGQKKLELFLKNTIEDSYTITHECFHYINMDLFNNTGNWSLMTEAISLTAEGLQRKYFKSKKLLDYKNNDRNTFYAIGDKAYRLDFEIKLLKYYLKHKYVDKSFIRSFLELENERYVNAVIDDIEDIIERNELIFFDHQRYIIAAILSSLLVNKIITKPSDVKMLIELNDNCNKFSFIDSLKYLGLEIIDENLVVLSEDSLNFLNEEYQKRLTML